MAKVQDKWLATAPGGHTEVQEIPAGTINGVNTDFVLTSDPISGSLKVFLDGLKDTAYTYDSPSKTVTMTTAPVVGQNIEVIYNI